MTSASPFSPEKWWTSDSVAVVTGTNKGIGKEIARLLAQQGLTVVATARNDEAGRKTAEELSQSASDAGTGGKVVFHALDISKTDSIAAFKEWLQRSYPSGITMLVNNAAMAYKGDTFGPQELRTTLATNYEGTAQLTEALLPLITAKGGRVVTVSSRAGLLGILRSPELRKRFELAADKATVDALVNEFVTLVESGDDKALAAAGWPKSMYGISKLAISSYMRALAPQAAAKGILVAACCPGYVATDMSSFRGTKTPTEGADTPVWLTLQPPGTLEQGLLWAERSSIPY